MLLLTHNQRVGQPRRAARARQMIPVPSLGHFQYAPLLCRDSTAITIITCSQVFPQARRRQVIGKCIAPHFPGPPRFRCFASFE
jgi:hypothetical protein